MQNKSTIAVLFGGQSAEHDVSIQSAENVRSALLAAGYPVTLIGIDRQGVWHRAPDIGPVDQAWPTVAILPGNGGHIVTLDRPGEMEKTDVVFPVLHGPRGEDGSLQGLLKLANVAYVGPDILASALCMDKEFSKHMLKDAGIPTVKTLSFDRAAVVSHAIATRELGSPLFVKPANMGSSVGVSKAHTEAEYDKAVETAFQYDTKVVVESFAEGQEIECAVLSRDGLQASVPGEIVPTNNEGFYSYDAKYIDDKGAKLVFPANLPSAVTQQIQDMSIAAARALGCEGMVRVDFFLKSDGTLLVNELNTIPGFTAISMYPKLWEASGIPPDELVVHLIDHALARFQRESALSVGRSV